MIHSLSDLSLSLSFFSFSLYTFFLSLQAFFFSHTQVPYLIIFSVFQSPRSLLSA
ncbi:hypothetical protein Hanom_Chr04g00338641 [Helianthus anomalus]